MKLRAPILSADARGRFADALVLGIWRGINCLLAPVRTGPKKSCGIIATKEVQNACQQVVTREAV